MITQLLELWLATVFHLVLLQRLKIKNWCSFMTFLCETLYCLAELIKRHKHFYLFWEEIASEYFKLTQLKDINFLHEIWALFHVLLNPIFIFIEVWSKDSFSRRRGRVVNRICFRLSISLVSNPRLRLYITGWSASCKLRFLTY